VLTLLEELTDEPEALLRVILNLLNGPWNEDPGDPEPIDYSVTPDVVTEDDLESLGWLLDDTAAHYNYADFIVSNLDALLNWAWKDLVFLDNAAGTDKPLKTLLEDLLSGLGIGTVTLKPTLEGTVQSLLGDVLCTEPNLKLIVDAVANAVGVLLEMNLVELIGDAIEVEGLDLNDLTLTIGDIVKAVLSIDGDPVDLDAMFAGFMQYNSAAVTINGRDDFIDELVKILGPLAPVLGVFLLGYDLRIIPMVMTDPDGSTRTEAERTGLIKIFGGNGYEYGLLPLLMGIGADLGADYLDSLWTLDEIEGWTDGAGEGLMRAILEPVVALLDAVAANPVDSLLSVLPNLVYMLLPDFDETLETYSSSILSQALLNILFPVVNLAKNVMDGLAPDILESLEILGYSLEDLLGAGLNTALLGLLKDQLGLDLENPVINGLTILDLLAGLVAGTKTAYQDSDATKPGLAAYLEALGVKGVKGGSDYVAVDPVLLVVSLLEATDLLALLDDYGGEDLLRVIIGLLNGEWNTDPGQPNLIDYGVAPEPTVVTYPEGMTELSAQVQFLVDNVDAVLNWVWAALFADNQAGKEGLSELLGGLLSADDIADTIDGTLNALLGDLLFTRKNMNAIVGLVAGFMGDFVDLTLGEALNVDGLDLTINDLLKTVFKINKNGTYVDLDLAGLCAGFLDYDNFDGPEFANADEFVAELSLLLEPLMPVLRLLLTEGDLLGIVDPSIQPNGSFIKIWGANGYETGLLPLFMGLGAEIPGFLDTLKPYSAVKDDDAALLEAILGPILCLLNAAIDDPIGTILTVVPNLAHMILPGDSGDSILTQALVNLLFPVTSLLADESVQKLIQTLLPEGTLPPEIDLSQLGASLNAMLLGLVPANVELLGMNLNIMDLLYAMVAGDLIVFDKGFDTSYGDFLSSLGKDNLAQFLAVNKADLIVSLLNHLGVFKMLEELDIGGLGISLTSLLELLNYPGRLRDFLSPIHYPAPNLNADPYYGASWTRRDAVSLLGKLPGLLDDLLEMILGSKLDDFLQGMVGDSLYTENTLKSIVNALQDLLRDVDLDGVELIPGVTLGTLLSNPEAITIGDKPVNVIEIIDLLKGFEPKAGVNLNSKDGFVSELVRFLAPVVPLLDFILFGGNPGGPYNDLKILGIPVVDGNGNVFETGVIRAFGYEGYACGLIPILEALLLPLGLEGELTELETLRGLEGEEKLLAVLMPLLTAVDAVIASPLEGLLKLLPSIAYFTSAKNANGRTPLDESLDNTLYALTNLLNLAFGDAVPATMDGLLVFLLKVNILKEPFSLDVPALLDGLLFDALGIPNLGSALLKNLLVGTPYYYTSNASGGDALFLSLLLPEDRADLLTVVLRTVIELIQGNKDTREVIVSMLQNLIIKDGNFGSTALHWGIHFVLWCLRICGTELTMEKFHRLTLFLSWFMPVIRKILGIFGVFK